jgi:hypothetical protein
MTVKTKRDTQDREDAYLKSGTMTEKAKRDTQHRECPHLTSGTMTEKAKRDTQHREHIYLKSGTMTVKTKRDTQDREHVYLKSGTMTVKAKRNTDVYSSLLNQGNLAQGAVERINIERRVLGQPELTMDQAKEIGSHSDEYMSGYWNSSMSHGGFWTDDQPAGKPNFIEGGQANRFGFTQSTYHKLHCLANFRTILAWQITGNGNKMTRDMNAHAIHCLVSVAKSQVTAFSCLVTNLYMHQ